MSENQKWILKSSKRNYRCIKTSTGRVYINDGDTLHCTTLVFERARYRLHSERSFWYSVCTSFMAVCRLSSVWNKTMVEKCTVRLVLKVCKLIAKITKFCFILILIEKCTYTYVCSSVHAKPRLSQVNVRQNLFATGINLGLPVTMTGTFCQILLYIQWCDR